LVQEVDLGHHEPARARQIESETIAGSRYRAERIAGGLPSERSRQEAPPVRRQRAACRSGAAVEIPLPRFAMDGERRDGIVLDVELAPRLAGGARGLIPSVVLEYLIQAIH